jgi:hypothetical protein
VAADGEEVLCAGRSRGAEMYGRALREAVPAASGLQGGRQIPRVLTSPAPPHTPWQAAHRRPRGCRPRALLLVSRRAGRLGWRQHACVQHACAAGIAAERDGRPLTTSLPPLPAAAPGGCWPPASSPPRPPQSWPTPTLLTGACSMAGTASSWACRRVWVRQRGAGRGMGRGACSAGAASVLHSPSSLCMPAEARPTRPPCVPPPSAAGPGHRVHRRLDLLPLRPPLWRAEKGGVRGARCRCSGHMPARSVCMPHGPSIHATPATPPPCSSTGCAWPRMTSSRGWT